MLSARDVQMIERWTKLNRPVRVYNFHCGSLGCALTPEVLAAAALAGVSIVDARDLFGVLEIFTVIKARTD